jgi:hypothetical protein
MKRSAAIDERQGVIPVDLPVAPRTSSDEQARNDALAMIGELERAKLPPWSARLLGWQRLRFVTLAQRLTPVEAAALTISFQEQLERLGPPED